MRYLKNKITGIRNILSVFTESTSRPYLKIIAMILLGISVVLFESLGLSMLVPILQKMVNGIDEKITIPISFLTPLESWLNRWNGYQQLAFIGGVIFVAGLCKALLTAVNNVANESFSLKIGNYWSEKLFRNILLADVSKTLKYKIGSLQNYLVVECGRLRFLYRGMLQVFTSAVMGIFYLLILLTISAKLTILVVFIFAVFSIPVLHLIRHIRHTSYNRAQARSAVGSIIIEALSSLKTLHLYKTFDFECGRFRHCIDDVLKKEFQMVKKSAFIGLISQITGIIVPLFIIAISLFFARASGSQFLWIVLFIAIFSRLLPIVQKIYNSMSLISKFYGSIILIKKHINKFDSYQLNNGSIKINTLPQKIIFEKVEFRYSNHTPAIIKNVSFTLDKGEFAAFVGPSGSGKTTLVALIMRLFDPDEGDIFLDSVNLRDVDVYSWRNFVGLVDQNAILFNESIKYNICYGLQEVSEAKIINAAKMANAHDFIIKLPHGYDTQAGTMGGALSGGQRQRIAIAQALIRNPGIIILDEATSSIDSESEELISDVIKQLKQNGKTIISIAHRLSSVKDADRMFFIENGELKAQGSFTELVTNNARFAKYVKLQTSVTA